MTRVLFFSSFFVISANLPINAPSRKEKLPQNANIISHATIRKQYNDQVIAKNKFATVLLITWQFLLLFLKIDLKNISITQSKRHVIKKIF